MNLVEGIQQECSRIREEVIPAYDSIGAAGAFGKMMIAADVKQGEAAIASGDAIQMLAVYQKLKDVQA